MNGCQGIKTCSGGVFGTCVATQNYCDTNCDGTQECTSGTCPTCSCIGSETQSCLTANGCQGQKVCTDGVFGQCVASQSFCDTNCDGTEECTSGTCPTCSCIGSENQSCTTVNGCQGLKTCTGGVFGQCISTQNYCDTDCDGTDECTSGTCPTCSCTGSETQSCTTANGCQGTKTCDGGAFGTCISSQNYCDTNCDGTDECTDQECPACSCTGNETQNCRTTDGCQGKRTCNNGVYGSCEAVQNYCDTDCDGTKECTSEECSECSCVVDWLCTDYGACIEGLQTRTCTDQSHCGNDTSKPATSKACSSGTNGGSGGGGGSGGTGSSGGSGTTTTGRCRETWVCSDWSGCSVSNLKTRTCSDSNNCGTTASKPAEAMTCRRTGTCSDGLMNNDEEGIDCGGSCPNSCEVVNRESKPEFEIDGGPIDAEIFDMVPYKVTVTNTGDAQADGVEVSADKWTDKPTAMDLMLAGDEQDVELDLYMPGDPAVTNLTVQVLYKGVPVATKAVQATIQAPDHAVKLTEDTDTGRFYPTVIFDNRDNAQARAITYEYSVSKDGETYVLDSSGENQVQAHTLYVKTESKAIADLPDGTYDVKSVFYEKGKSIGEYTSTVTIGNNKKSFKVGYIFYAIIIIVIGFFGYTLYSNYKTLNER